MAPTAFLYARSTTPHLIATSWVSTPSDVLEEHDGPMLKHGLCEASRPHGDADGQELHGEKIILPRHKVDWPDGERLEMRFVEFRMPVVEAR